MASFNIAAPLSLNEVKMAVQDDSPERSRTARDFDTTSPGTYLFTATEQIQSSNYTAGTTLPLAQPYEMVNIVIRPNVGQVYPRSV